VLCLEVPYGPNSSQPHIGMLPSWIPDLRFLTFGKSWTWTWIVLCTSQISCTSLRILQDGIWRAVMSSSSGDKVHMVMLRCKMSSLDIPREMTSDRSSDPRWSVCLLTNCVWLVALSATLTLAESPLWRTAIDSPEIIITGTFFIRDIWTEVEHPLSYSRVRQRTSRLRFEIRPCYQYSTRSSKSWKMNGYFAYHNYQMKIIINIKSPQRSELLGVVSILDPALCSSYSTIVPPEEFVVARCLHTDGLMVQIEESAENHATHKSPFSREHLGRDNFPASWLVPKGARSGDLILLAVGSQILLLVRPRPSSRTYEFIGQAMPCQMTREDEFPSQVLYRLIKNFGEPRRSTEYSILA
jgi:hypothetical protein